MKSTPELSFNEKIETYGENIEARVVIIRHGEKTHDPENLESSLTEDGRVASANFGKTRKLRDIVKPSSSNTTRTKDTALLATEHSPTVKKGTYINRPELSFEYDEHGLLANKIKEIKKDTLGEDYKKIDKSEFDKRIKEASNKTTNFFLDFENSKPDEKTNSPIEVASKMAKLLLTYIEMTKRLKSGSNVDLINATHDLNIASFLKEVISGKKTKSDSRNFDIQSIGGAIGYNEGFEIIIHRTDKDNFSLKLLFRENEYDIDKKVLEDLGSVEYKK